MMTQKPPPVLLAIVICDLVIRDEMTKKLTLVGVFSTVHGRALPVRLAGGMHLYAALTDGRGEYKHRITIRHLELDKVVFQAEGPITFQHPQQVVEINMKLPQLTFPAWGRYEISLYCEDELIGTRTFVVRPLPPGQALPPGATPPPAIPGPSEPPSE